MQVSAEIRWFWRENPPPDLEGWFQDSDHHGCTSGGGSPNAREDIYLCDDDQVELGIKVRGGNSGVEVKGLVAAKLGILAAGEFIGPIELWSKWISRSLSLDIHSTITLQKWRKLRKFDTTGPSPVEIELGADEKPKEYRLPKTGCNVEFTNVYIPKSSQTWWTLGFEAFGTILTVEKDLQAVAAVLHKRHPPTMSGGMIASYPAWLKDRVLPAAF